MGSTNCKLFPKIIDIPPGLFQGVRLNTAIIGTKSKTIGNMKVNTTDPNNQFFIIQITDDSIFGDLNINIPNLTEYYLTKEGLIIRGFDEILPNIEIKLILSNSDNNSLFKLQLLIRKTITIKCQKCTKTLIDIQLVGEKE